MWAAGMARCLRVQTENPPELLANTRDEGDLPLTFDQRVYCFCTTIQAVSSHDH